MLFVVPYNGRIVLGEALLYDIMGRLPYEMLYAVLSNMGIVLCVTECATTGN